MSEPVLVTRDLKRSFVQGGVTIHVLRGVNTPAGTFGQLFGTSRLKIGSRL